MSLEVLRSNIIESSGHLESLSKQSEDTRIRILKCIAEHQPVSVKEVSSKTGINSRSTYKHIRRMRAYLDQKAIGRYSLSEHGEDALKRIKSGQHIEWVLLPSRTPKHSASILLLEAGDTSLAELNMVPGRKFTAYRSVHDIIASILLLGKKGFGVGEAIQKTGVPYTRIMPLLNPLEEKQLIQVVDSPAGRRGKYWKTTEKGLIFLYLYGLMQGLLK